MEISLKSSDNFWNSFAHKYDKFIYRNAGSVYDRIIAGIKKEMASDMQVLEIGSGTGIVSLAVAPFVRCITAIDPAEEMLAVAREKQTLKRVKNIDFVAGTTDKLNINHNCMDAILVVNVLHLLDDPCKEMLQIYRLVKDGGLIITPTYCHGANLKSHIISSFMSLFGFKAKTRWSKESFRRFVESNHFNIVHEEIINGKIPLSFIVAKKEDKNE